MTISITMPRLSDTMEQGTIIKWNIKEGDEVASGAIVADVETDKATMEMQVYDDGVVARILVGVFKIRSSKPEQRLLAATRALTSRADEREARVEC